MVQRITLAVFVLLLFSGTALAQTVEDPQVPAVISSLEVALWPEYDRPELLVIYHGRFAPETPLPLAVELGIPAAAGGPSALAYVTEGGERLNLTYTTRAEGEWLMVAFELGTQAFQLEYYVPLTSESGVKTYNYAFAADYAVQAFRLEVQVPPTAEGFVLEPEATSVSRESDGLVYHVVEAGALAQGEKRSWTFTYQKPDAVLTVDQSEPPQAAAPPATAAQPEQDSTVLVFLIAFVALVTVGVTAFWLGRRTQPPSSLSAAIGQQTYRPAASGRPTARLEGDAVVFCRQCGTRLRTDSVFCHKCGGPVQGS